MKRADIERLDARRVRWWKGVAVGAVVCVVIFGVAQAVRFLRIVRTGALKAEARGECSGLYFAVKAFDLEYSRFPIPEGSTADVREETDEAFMAILLGAEHVANPHGKVFYSGREAGKDGTRGLLVVDPKLGPRFMDPWGRTYRLVIDGDGDGFVTGPDGTRIKANVVCYSLGEDGVFDAKKDPKTW